MAGKEQVPATLSQGNIVEHDRGGHLLSSSTSAHTHMGMHTYAAHAYTAHRNVYTKHTHYFKYKSRMSMGIAQSVKCSPSMHDTLGLIPGTS